MTLARAIPPDNVTAYPLQNETWAVSAALFPELRKYFSEFSNRPVALWRLTPLPLLAVYSWLRSISAVPVFLNDRWTVFEVASVLQRYPCAAIIIPSSDSSLTPPLSTPVKDKEISQLTTTFRNFKPEQRFAPPIICHLSRHNASATYSAYISFYPPTIANISTAVLDSIAIPFSDGVKNKDGSSPSPAAIFFTSGTTNRPKAVALTDTNLNVQSNAKKDVLRLDSSMVYLHLAPLYHIGGFSSAHATTTVGGTHAFASPSLHPSDPKGAEGLLDRLSQVRCTTVVAVPTTLQYLANIALEKKLVIQSVSSVLYGGGPTDSTLRQRLGTIFPNARIIGAYGMTECASSITFLDHSALQPSSSLHMSAGWPPPHVELLVKPIPNASPDCDGEIWTKGPHVTPGYLQAGWNGTYGLSSDSWLPTGDLGSVDRSSGALYLHGRMDDVIRSGGETVLAPEVEMCLRSHNFVLDAAVVGLPHEILGSAIAAAVELTLPTIAFSPALMKLKMTCQQSLASYKRPKWIIPMRHLPRSITGKVLKRELVRSLRHRLLQNPTSGQSAAL